MLTRHSPAPCIQRGQRMPQLYRSSTGPLRGRVIPGDCAQKDVSFATSRSLEHLSLASKRDADTVYIIHLSEIRTNYENVINEVEMIQLLNLRPRDTEEAKVLVTS